MPSVRLGKKTWADDIVGEPIKVVEKRDRRICTAAWPGIPVRSAIRKDSTIAPATGTSRGCLPCDNTGRTSDPQ